MEFGKLSHHPISPALHLERRWHLLQEYGGQNLLYHCFLLIFQAGPELFQDLAAGGNVRSIPVRNGVVVHTQPVLLVGVNQVWYSVF